MIKRRRINFKDPLAPRLYWENRHILFKYQSWYTIRYILYGEINRYPKIADLFYKLRVDDQYLCIRGIGGGNIYTRCITNGLFYPYDWITDKINNLKPDDSIVLNSSIAWKIRITRYNKKFRYSFVFPKEINMERTELVNLGITI